MIHVMKDLTYFKCRPSYSSTLILQCFCKKSLTKKKKKKYDGKIKKVLKKFLRASVSLWGHFFIFCWLTANQYKVIWADHLNPGVNVSLEQFRFFLWHS